ncbi:hypothetical protein C0Q94_14860 [Streptomyces albidoflavus]|nr:hypothetical protein C0Q94_14860 [Streptomyces albidoflavus]
MRCGWAPPVRARRDPGGATDWPQAPAGLGFGVAGLRPCVPVRDPAGHRWPQSPAGLWGFAVRSPVGSGGAAPGYLLTNCQVRGQSLQGGLACSLLRGHPGTSPPFRLVGVVPPVGGGQGRHPLIFVTSESDDGRHCGEARYR